MSGIAQKAQQSHIIPDVVDHIIGSTLLKVSWPQARVAANCGNELKASHTMEPPHVEWEAEDTTLYTLIKTDPDAPSRKNPTKREWQHWIVSNIPGGNIHQGTTLCEYIGAGPPKGSGLHRYVFLLFKQPQGKIELKEEKRLSNRTGQGRGGWSARAFARKYGLGDPIAANWYEAEWDHSVDKLYERLSGK